MMKALTDIGIGEGQKTHVLCNAITSHFMMNVSKPLILEYVLGYANIRETMRYVHFTPDHLEEAASLNPITNLEGLYE